MEQVHPPHGASWELDPIRERRTFVFVFEVVRRHPGHRLGRYAIADRRITRRQQETFRAREPQLAVPAQPARRLTATNRQNVSSRLRRLRVAVVCWQHVFEAHLKATRERFDELERIGRAEAAVLILVLTFASDEIDILPNRDAVDTPSATQRPTRQRLARIPFALSIVKHCAGRQFLAEASDLRSIFSQTGTPSIRQAQLSAQRGNGSPGYHLPCP